VKNWKFSFKSSRAFSFHRNYGRWSIILKWSIFVKKSNDLHRTRFIIVEKIWKDLTTVFLAQKYTMYIIFSLSKFFYFFERDIKIFSWAKEVDMIPWIIFFREFDKKKIIFTEKFEYDWLSIDDGHRENFSLRKLRFFEEVKRIIWHDDSKELLKVCVKVLKPVLEYCVVFWILLWHRKIFVLDKYFKSHIIYQTGHLAMKFLSTLERFL
jgi:hypothetical protein